MKYTAALFDFDGTLANSNELINRTHLTILDELFPGVYTKDTVRQFNGPSLREVYERLVPEKAEETIERYRNLNSDLHDEMISLFDGVLEELKCLKKNGVKLAIVSTKRNDMIERGIQVLGLEGLFDVIIGSYSYKHFKPNPEPIYRALAELNVLHNQAIMIGDNAHDIESATNAGIPSVFVEWSQKTIEEIAPYRPSYSVQSMAELTTLILEDSQNNNSRKGLLKEAPKQ